MQLAVLMVSTNVKMGSVFLEVIDAMEKRIVPMAVMKEQIIVVSLVLTTSMPGIVCKEVDVMVCSAEDMPCYIVGLP